MNKQLLDWRFLLKLFKDSFSEWNKDNAMRLAAALSYYSVFSIAPLLMIAIGIVSWVYHKDAQNGMLEPTLAPMIGAKAAEAVQSLVKDASKSSSSATVVGFVTLLVGASTVFAQLKDSLDTMWEVRTKPGLGIWSMIRERLLSFGMVLVIGFLLLISLMISTMVAAMGGWMEHKLGVPKFISGTLGLIVPLTVETVLFGLMYKMLPSAKIQWRCVTVGAVFTALLFEFGKWLLSWYLGSGGPTSSFGAAGSVVLVLLWVYYASCIMFFGASVTEVYARTIGVPIQPADNAESTEFHCPPTGAAPASGSGLGSAPISGAVVPAPARESLLPMLREAHADTARLVGPRPVPRTMAGQTRTWLQDLHAHPLAEVGAAVGVGLAAGLVSRLFEKSEPMPKSAIGHFALGAEAATKEGKTLAKHALAAGRKWLENIG